MTAVSPDRVLRRFEIDAGLCAVLFTAVGAVLPGGGLHMSAAVAAGAALIWLSYLTMKAGVDAAVRRSSRAWALVNLFTRFAILAIAAYVIVARLRLHPIGVVLGTSSFVAAAAVMVVRSLRAGRSRRTAG